MALFKKKIDPITERSKALNDQIAALEAEIERLGTEDPGLELAQAPPKTPVSLPVGSTNTPPPPNRPGPQPRLRSTAFPHKHQGPGVNPFSEPVFEEVPAQRDPHDPEPPPAPQQSELGVRKYDLAALWHRLINNFRGPATSNPKLVNYLAAGSIQGLRPLRYEKRVARNRFIVLVLVLIAVLWGLIAVLMKRT